MFKRRPSKEGESISFAEVFPRELAVVEESRRKRQAPAGSRPLDKDLIGLAFSGGGIRSATFNLGVIQALARHNLLRVVDYLSTVSGGGYIGSWLSSWAYSVGRQSNSSENQIGQIEDTLNSTPRNISDLSEPHQIHFLRKYSNYLTPRLGMLSGDTLAVTADGSTIPPFSQQIVVPSGGFLANLTTVDGHLSADWTVSWQVNSTPGSKLGR